MGTAMNLLVIIAVGVIIADMIKNGPGTTALFKGLTGLWTTGVNGMLGNAPK